MSQEAEHLSRELSERLERAKKREETLAEQRGKPVELLRKPIGSFAEDRPPAREPEATP